MAIHGKVPENRSLAWGTYVCPACKECLEPREGCLHCPYCLRSYPIIDGLPDFVLEDLHHSSHPVLRGIRSIDRLAGIYESRAWYPLVLALYAGLGVTSLPQLVEFMSQVIASVRGVVLDAACGPGTFGRRLASPDRTVYGIDVSMGMLHRGARYADSEGLDNVHFARALVDALPFRDGEFDAALCCGALHLFPDAQRALREIGRTMRAQAPLGVVTFTAGRRGILKYRRVREHAERAHGARIFELPALERYVTTAGFYEFRPRVLGSLLVFSARRAG